MTRFGFWWRFGRWPVQDDLERVNCSQAGQIGHWGCGICVHHKPRWQCWECVQKLDRRQA